ncbi:MAG: DUF885 domain-containing protein [Candidatus Bathyarchaeia archaeon]
MVRDVNFEFDLKAREMFETFTRRDPVLATSLGIHTYDHLLPDSSLRAKIEDIEIMRRFMEDFEMLDGPELTQDRKFDRDLAIDSLRLSLFFDEEIKFWSSSPEAPHILGTALFLLLSRDFAPLESRLKSLKGRIDSIPRFLRGSMERLKDPVELWVRLAVQATEGLPHLLRESIDLAEKVEFEGVDELAESSVEASTSIGEYRDWLVEEVTPKSRRDFAIGKEKIDKILELRGLGLTSDELLRFAYSSLEKEKRKLVEVAGRIRPGAPIEEVRRIVKANHPRTFNELIQAYRDSIRDAKDFTVKSGSFTLPGGEEVIVRDTPLFMRSLVSTAAIFQPAKFDERQTSIYLITPHEDQRFLQEHNYYSIPNTTVHETYPGHHLQGCCANMNPSLIRLLTPFPAEFVEGWAHYCEEYMKEMGFADSPESRFEQVEDMIWRVTRIILDIKLARGEITLEEAVDYLVEQTGMERQVATIEVNEYAERPTYFLSYYLGKHMILNLKSELKGRLGEKFDERRFHDLLLYSGNLPMKYIRRLVMEEFKVELGEKLL